MIKISKTVNAKIMIDADDAHLLDEAELHLHISRGKAYIEIYKDKKSHKLHRVIMNAKDGDIVDHINGNTLDNTKQNLRFVTHQQNMFNRKSKRKYKGVKLLKDCYRARPYQAKISKDGKEYSLGCYKTEEQAALAYNKKALELFGEFASLNEIK